MDGEEPEDEELQTGEGEIKVGGVRVMGPLQSHIKGGTGPSRGQHLIPILILSLQRQEAKQMAKGCDLINWSDTDTEAYMRNWDRNAIEGLIACVLPSPWVSHFLPCTQL